MNAHALAGYVDSEELRAVFARLAVPGSFFILEGFTDLYIGQVETVDGNDEPRPDPSTYEEGRLFDSVFELHWQRMRGLPAHVPPFRISLISDDKGQINGAESGEWLTSSGNPAKPLALEWAGSSSIYLWGETVGGPDGKPMGLWYEKEVPRLFRYPLEQVNVSSRIKVMTQSYQFQSAPEQPTEDAAQSLQRFAGFKNA